MEVLTKDGLTYYHNKIKNTFVKQSDLDTAIENKLDTIDWVTEIGDAYVTPEQVEDIISQADLDGYMPKTGGTFTGTVNGVTPPEGDNSTKLATTAYVQSALNGGSLDDYLPKSGGTMTGKLNFQNFGNNIGITEDNGYFAAYGGNSTYSASLVLRGNNYTEYNNQGSFSLRATDGNEYKELIGMSDGELKWNNKNIATFDSNNKLVFPDGTTVWIELPTT